MMKKKNILDSLYLKAEDKKIRSAKIQHAPIGKMPVPSRHSLKVPNVSYRRMSANILIDQ